MARNTGRRFRHLFSIALAAILLSAASGIWAGVGDPMTDFSLQDLRGGTHTLQDYQDRVLVLFFMGHN